MLKNLPSLRPSPCARLAVAAGLFLYLVVIRTRGISDTFCLLGDQILYWRMALGPWDALPAGGAPTSVGGTTLGPVFCWLMWLMARTIGPLFDYLPHAGGIGISLVHSAADAVLLLALWRRFGSAALALAVTLVAATSPFDMSLTATIWNPPVAVALVKVSIACVLWSGEKGRLSWDAGAITAAWLAVQVHYSAIFFAAPVIASFSARELLARRSRRALVQAAIALSILLVLQLPYLIDKVRHPSAPTSPGAIVESLAYTVTHPSTLRAGEAFHATAGALAYLLARPASVVWPGPLLALCAGVAAWRFRRDLPLVAATVAPLVLAVAGFSLWQRPYDTYWFMVLAPAAVLTVVLGVTAWRPVARPVLALLVAAVVVAQPARLAEAATLHRLPEYGVIVQGSRETLKRVGEVRRIDTDFVLPPTAEPDFVYRVLGGRLSPVATYSVTIDRAGRARFAAADGKLPVVSRK